MAAAAAAVPFEVTVAVAAEGEAEAAVGFFDGGREREAETAAAPVATDAEEGTRLRISSHQTSLSENARPAAGWAEQASSGVRLAETDSPGGFRSRGRAC